MHSSDRVIVTRGSWQQKEVAIKNIPGHIRSFINEFQNELQVLKKLGKLNHPNIIQFFGSCGKPHFCFIEEYMSMGSLHSVLSSNHSLDANAKIQIAMDIAAGLLFLHQQFILHGDLKSLNILLNSFLKAKLADFGLSKTGVRIQVKNSKGIPIWKLCAEPEYFDKNSLWASPEHFLDKEYSNKSEIYSFGVILMELATRKLPNRRIQVKNTEKFSAKQASIPSTEPNSMPSETKTLKDIPTDFPRKLETLMKACLEEEPNERPDAEMAYAFLKSNNDDYMSWVPSFNSTPMSFTMPLMFSNGMVNQSTQTSSEVTTKGVKVLDLVKMTGN